LSRSSDDLIQSIQDGTVAKNAPPRPFWDNFVREQENETIMSTLKRAMQPYEIIDSGERIDLSTYYLESDSEA